MTRLKSRLHTLVLHYSTIDNITYAIKTRDSNPGPVFSIPRFGIGEFLIPGSRDPGGIMRSRRYDIKNRWIYELILLRVAPNLTFSNSAEAEFGRISELKFGRSRSRIWLKLVFRSESNTPVIKLMASTMLSAAIEAVHFSASCVALLFASYW